MGKYREKNREMVSARGKCGLTQKDLAKKCGVAIGTIVFIENGNLIPKVTLALRIAEELGKTVEELFGDNV